MHTVPSVSSKSQTSSGPSTAQQSQLGHGLAHFLLSNMTMSPRPYLPRTSQLCLTCHKAPDVNSLPAHCRFQKPTFFCLYPLFLPVEGPCCLSRVHCSSWALSPSLLVPGIWLPPLQCLLASSILSSIGSTPEARRGSQGASRAAPGKSGLHARGEGERVLALE